jgi:hypothetical protein
MIEARARIAADFSLTSGEFAAKLATMRKDPPLRVGARVRFGIAALAALAAMLLFSGGALAVTGAGVQYKLRLTAEGKETLSDSFKAVPGETRKQAAEWTFLPKPVNVWIPRFNGPPGEGNAGAMEYPTFDERIAGPIGKVNESGTFVEEEAVEPFSCSSSVGFSGPIIHRVIVTPLDPTIEIETDFHGALEAMEGEGMYTNTVGSPCFVRPKEGAEEHGFFRFDWDDPTGQRLQVGILVPQMEVGDPFIGGPAQDYNNVATSESAEDCFRNVVRTCKVTFNLSGEYDLEKICEGTIANGAGTCNGGSSQTGEEKKSGKGAEEKGSGRGKEKGKGGTGKGGKEKGAGKGKQGAAKAKCVVPDLKGEALAKAKKDLGKAHCALGKAKGKRGGTVASESPKAGTRHAAGFRVNIKLA